MVLPRRLRELAGVSEGTLMKIDVLKGPRIVLTPQVTVDRPPAKRPPKNRKQVLDELMVAFAELQKDAMEKGLDKMTMSEINRAVAWARRDLKKNPKRPAK